MVKSHKDSNKRAEVLGKLVFDLDFKTNDFTNGFKVRLLNDREIQKMIKLLTYISQKYQDLQL